MSLASCVVTCRWLRKARIADVAQEHEGRAGTDIGASSGALMNIRRAAEYLGISHHTLYKLVARRQVPAAKIGGSWRLSREALDAFIAARSTVRAPTCLIFEPSDRARQELASYARGAGRVMVCASADEAVAAATDVNPDLIFMPADPAGGPAAAKIVRRMRVGGATSRIVLLIGPHQAELLQETLELGPLILLRRPVDRADVASVLALITS